jgi:hypothetical protein
MAVLRRSLSLGYRSPTIGKLLWYHRLTNNARSLRNITNSRMLEPVLSYCSCAEFMGLTNILPLVLIPHFTLESVWTPNLASAIPYNGTGPRLVCLSIYRDDGRHSKLSSHKS